MNQRKIDLTPGKFCNDSKGRKFYICNDSDLAEIIQEDRVVLARYIQQVSVDDVRVVLYSIPKNSVESTNLHEDFICYDTTKKRTLDPFYGNASERILARRIYHIIKKAEKELAQTK